MHLHGLCWPPAVTCSSDVDTLTSAPWQECSRSSSEQCSSFPCSCETDSLLNKKGRRNRFRRPSLLFLLPSISRGDGSEADGGVFSCDCKAPPPPSVVPLPCKSRGG